MAEAQLLKEIKRINFSVMGIEIVGVRLILVGSDYYWWGQAISDLYLPG